MRDALGASLDRLTRRARRGRPARRGGPAVRAGRFTLLLLLVVVPAAGRGAEVIDRGVALVEDRVVTESDVRFEQALAALDPSLLSFLPDPVRRADDRAIDLRILQAMAGRLRLASPGVALVEEHLDRMRRAAPSPVEWVSFLDRWGLTEDDLRAILRERLAIESWLVTTLGGGPGATVDAAAYERWMAPRREAAGIHRLAPLPEEE